MVAKIAISKNIEAALNYNEKKVEKGQAECLFAENYLLEAKSMNFYQKLAGFENLNMLNERATTKTLHVSLNFDPSEKLSNNKLSEIASSYMEKIGFGDQPYLVYQHHDAGHPHLHIVSTTIQQDGSRINTHNIGRNESEKARKEIEKNYNLVKAEKQAQNVKQQIKPVDASKVMYGKSETKRSIANVVNAVVTNYKFTSLPELNAALKQFNLIADRGSEDGRIFKNRGLLYRVLDANENKIGVPIKASSISSNPTLNTIEEKFTANKVAREQFKARTKEAIDEALEINPNNLKNLIASLEKKQVYTLIRQNKEGLVYGITFVDNHSRCVFNGSDLGKQYSAASLQTRISTQNHFADKDFNHHPNISTINVYGSNQNKSNVEQDQQQSKEKDLKDNLLEQLISPKEQNTYVPSQLLEKKRHKKNKNLRL